MHRAQHHAGHQGAGRRPQREAAAAGQRHAHQPEQQPGRQAQREGQRVDLADLALGVAEEGGRLVHAFARHDGEHPVARLQDEAVGGDHVEVATLDPGDRPAELLREVEFRNRLAHQLRARDQEATEIDIGTVMGQGRPGGAAERLGRFLDRALGAHHQDRVTLGQLLAGLHHSRQRGAPVVAQFDLLIGPARQFVEGHRVLDHHAQAADAGAGQGRRVALAGPLASDAQRDHDDRQHHPDRVGERVADGHQGVTVRCPGRRGQCRCGGERTRVGSGDAGGAHAGQLADHRAHERNQDQDHDAQPHQRPLRPQVSQERRSGGQPDGEDEQRQPEPLQHPQ